MPVLVGPLGDIRAQIEAATTDPDLTPEERLTVLADWQQSLTDLLGRADEYAARARKVRDAGAQAVTEALTAMRSDADWRDEMLRRGLSDEATLDSVGVFSHERLDELAEEGLLEASALEVREAHAQYRDVLHPRDRKGRWRDVLGNLPGYASTATHLANAAGSVKKLHQQWADLDRDLLPFAGNPRHPDARRIIEQQKTVTKAIHHMNVDRGGPEGVGLPGGPKDVLVVGAGPAGLSAAVYGATEGLDTMLVDSNPDPGGQAHFSSRIENVIGFPSGVTGRQYASASLEQAQRVGADTKFGLTATKLDYDPKSKLKTVHFSDGSQAQARTVVMAGGVQFRRMNFPGADATGVVYGDSEGLKRLSGDEPCVIVGGANSAGQAAVDAASHSPHVTILIRGSDIRAKMSSYLVDQLEHASNVDILEDAEIERIEPDANGHVHRVILKNGSIIDAAGVGLFVGSGPQAAWSGLDRDKRGFVTVHDGLETSTPGVYAAGDVRTGSVHRVITAAADGAFAISQAHQFMPGVSVQEAAVEGLGDWPDDEADRLLEAMDRLDQVFPFTGFDEVGDDTAAEEAASVLDPSAEPAVPRHASPSRASPRLAPPGQALPDQSSSTSELGEAGAVGEVKGRTGSLGGQAEKAFEKLHPRDRSGRWRDVPGISITPTNVGGHLKVTGPQGELAVKASREEAEHAADQLSDTYVDRKTGTPKDPGTGERFMDVDPRPFGQDPEVLTRARDLILSGQPTTRDLYSQQMADGTRVYDKSRRIEHEKIIEAFLRMGDDQNPGTGERHHPPTDRKPQVFFTGGGFASGKGGVVGGEEGTPRHEWYPEGTPIVIDPDKIKPLLPEYSALQKAGDPEANLRAYEEAWDVAQAVVKRVQDEGLDAIVDGIGDTSADEVTKRVQSFTDAGYDTPKGVYVFTPTDVAIGNAHRRMEKAIKAGKAESIRYIPDDILRDVHGDVSRVMRDVMDQWPGDLQVYDTNTYNQQTDGFDPPKLIAHKTGGDIGYDNEQQFDYYLSSKLKGSSPEIAGPTVGPKDVSPAEAGSADLPADQKGGKANG